jgi:hypothetical protein
VFAPNNEASVHAYMRKHETLREVLFGYNANAYLCFMNKAKISKQEIKRLNDEFLGKRVDARDERGETHVGVLDFVGYNKFLPEWGFQVTLDRTPHDRIIPESIKLHKQR